MIRAIAVDDEPEALDILKIHASKLNELEIIGAFYKPEEAIQFLKHNAVDIIFLDVNMPGVSGFELLKQLKVRPLVVFTTAYEQYAVESYKFEAIDYLVKPIDFDDFQASVIKVTKAMNKDIVNLNETYIFVKDGTKTIKLFFDEILLLKASGNYVEFITKGKKISSRITITQLLDKLPKNIFIRVHNSFIINIEKINKIEHNHITVGEYKISIGESYRVNFYDRIKKRMI